MIITADPVLFIEDHMYSMMNAFLLLKPAMDTGNVPEFYKLFNSSALEVMHYVQDKVCRHMLY